MLVDVGAIAGSLVAIRLAARPETGSHTYGMKRAEILAAAANGLALLIVSALVTYDAVVRLVHPSHVDGAVLIVVAAVGVAVNLVATLAVARADRRSLNIEGAYRHILTDLYAFVGTLIAGIVIVVAGFDRADAIASLVVVALMLKAAVQLLRPALHILLEATPEDIDLEEVRRHLLELPEVQSVHDLHAWTLTSSLPILTAHVVVTDDCFNDGGGRPGARPPAGLPVGALRRRALDAAVRIGGAHRARARGPRLSSGAPEIRAAAQAKHRSSGQNACDTQRGRPRVRGGGHAGVSRRHARGADRHGSWSKQALVREPVRGLTGHR